MLRLLFLIALCAEFWIEAHAAPQILLGIDQLMLPAYAQQLSGKRIGLLTNHTAVNCRMESTVDVLKKNAKAGKFILAALFAPEHGLTGSLYAGKAVPNSADADGIPIYSLHGQTRKPTAEMLKGIDMLIYDIQDIGSRSYTYTSTLFYAMEECAKHNIQVVVLDRPNPLNGNTVDGPMLEKPFRSFLGHINVPYCHGMTVGELADYFNQEYNIGCNLCVIPMQGWQRHMSFQDTGLPWIPTSPYIPEPNSPFFYPTTGLLGEISLVNIGIGFTLPFKTVGAPWIDAKKFAAALNAQKFPGVHFEPFHYCPFYGKYAKESCQGVLIIITDAHTYRPFSTFYLLAGILKSLYPKKFSEALGALDKKKELFLQLLGSEAAYNLLVQEKNIVWKLSHLHDQEQAAFRQKRKKYLISAYSAQ